MPLTDLDVPIDTGSSRASTAPDFESRLFYWSELGGAKHVGNMQSLMVHLPTECLRRTRAWSMRCSVLPNITRKTNRCIRSAVTVVNSAMQPRVNPCKTDPPSLPCVKARSTRGGFQNPACF